MNIPKINLLNTARLSTLTSLALLSPGMAEDDGLTYYQWGGETELTGKDIASSEGSVIDSDWQDLVKVSLNASLRYDNNIFLTPRDEESDLIFTLAPTIGLSNSENAVNVISAMYTPSAKLYMDNSDLDAINHRFRFGYERQFAKTKIDLGVRYDKFSGSNRYASGQVDESDFGITFDTSYVLSGKTRLDLGLRYQDNSFDSGGLVDRKIYGAELGAQYQVTGKTSVGPYVSYENVDVSNSPDHNAVGIGAKFNYQATGKTAATGAIGFENRSYSGAGATGDTNPLTYSLGVSHDYTAKTSFNLNMYRSARAAYNVGGNGFESTGVTFSTEYAASERVSYHASATYEVNDYYATSSTAAGAADRDYYRLGFGADYAMPSGVKLGADLNWRESVSDNNAFEYENVTFDLGATYQF